VRGVWLAAVYHYRKCQDILWCSTERSIGMFWHNAAETWIDINHRTSASSPHVTSLFISLRNV